jgi:hypothetical protein
MRLRPIRAIKGLYWKMRGMNYFCIQVGEKSSIEIVCVGENPFYNLGEKKHDFSVGFKSR